jgi:subtilisin-like proprotein convertase family protein
LGATHVFSHEFQAGGTLIEPGSGSTIMAYAGGTIFYDMQSAPDPYFNSRNILQVQSNMATKFCSVDMSLVNVAPIVSAGNNFTIPKGTPFVLTGSVVSANPSALTYTWEENDPIPSAAFAGNNSFASATKTAGPNFRSLVPGHSPTRYFPPLNAVLSNILTTQFESVSDVARSFNFVFTARDNAAGGGQTASDSTILTVNANTGPFDVTSQNTDNISWAQGSTEIITWAVNNTNTLPGSANVDILLSTDGGLTYPIVLLSTTPNDGSQEITVPNITAIYCRIMVKPSANVYYDVNTKAFSIGYTTNCTTYSSTTPLVIPDGSGSESSGAVASSTFTVPISGIVTDVNVTLNVSHSWSTDLRIALRRPDGTEAIPWDRKCFLGNDWNFTFSDGAAGFDCIDNFGINSGTFAPSLPLSTLNNADASGVWTLTAADFNTGNTGQINSWSVEVCEKVLISLAVHDYQLDAITLYPNPSTTVLTISVPEGLLPNEFLIYNSIGQTISKGIVKSTADLAIDTTPFSAGVYMVRISRGNATKTLRFIKN